MTLAIDEGAFAVTPSEGPTTNRFTRLTASSRITNFADLQPQSARAMGGNARVRGAASIQFRSGAGFRLTASRRFGWKFIYCVEARPFRFAAPAARSLG